jgi:hypothetical protein
MMPVVSRRSVGCEPMTDKPETYAIETINHYRNVIAQLENAVDESRRAELQETAARLRDEWKAWQGEDSLHEMAFGEPAE